MRALASFAVLSVFAVFSALAGSAAPAQAQDDITIAYHLSYKCPAGGSGPGSSASNPITLEDFDEAWSATVNAIEAYTDGAGDKAGEEAGAVSPFECKWVKLSGHFRWSDYYSYRGRLYRSANGYYFDREISYLIENFADAATRRSELQARDVELVGRFYDLCAHAPNADMVFGPCHYGGYLGMMLSEVRILSVRAGEPQILTGEANRAIADSLRVAPANWKELAAVEQSGRDWLRLLQAGRKAYEAAVAEQLKPLKPEDRRAYFDPDGWVGTLLDPRRNNLTGKDVARLPARILFEPLAADEAEPDIWATACLCLEVTCEDRWPLFSYDAERMKERFICLRLQKDILGPGDAHWVWDE